MTALKRNKKVSESHTTTTTTTTTNQKGNDVGAMGGGNADTLLWQFVRSHQIMQSFLRMDALPSPIRSIFRFILCFLLYCYYIAILLTFLIVALFLLRLFIELFILRLFTDNESIINKIDDNYDYDYYYNSISIPAIRTNNKIADVNANADDDDDDDADADFSANFNIDFNTPQIVMLAGPHKTASTTIQTFMVQLAGQTISLEGRSKPPIMHINSTTPAHFKQYHVPHPSNQDWVWPLNSKNRTRNEAVEIASIKIGRPSKFYAPLLAWITGRRNNKFLDKSKRKRGYNTNTRAKQRQVLNYYRDLFQNVWNTNTENDNIYKYDNNNNNNSNSNNNNNIDDGTTPPPIWKKIVFGAEAFDTFVHDLPVDDNGNGNGGNSNNNTNPLLTGEDLHISPSANKRINILLDIMPWYDNKNKDTNTNDNGSSNNNNNNNTRRRPELTLEDIEVVVNYRTPRISHMVSIWHQLGHEKTLQEFLITPPNGRSTGRGHYQLNSLGLALQFVRRGIKTTILDMKGVQEKEEAEEEQQQQQQHDGDQDKHNNNESTNTILEIGGLQGVIACDVLKVSKMCNDRGKLMMSIDTKNNGTNEQPDNVAIVDKNKKDDKLERNLTEQQLKDIDEIINDYDCYVWKHLQKYNKKGTLRILYPSKSNIANLYNKTGPCSSSGGTTADDDDDNNGKKELTFQSMLTKIGNIARVPYVDDSPSPSPAAVIAEDPTETETN